MIYNSKSKQEKKMPKYLDNYKLNLVENFYYDNSNDFLIEVEHYFAKQIDTNKNFILKRFKINPSPFPPKTKSLNLSPEEQQLFDKLSNETLILKILEHQSIPKCLRMLKTSNNVYFVFQQYPFNPIQNYIVQNFISLDQKISLAVKIISTILYIHSKSVVYKGFDLNNIHVDKMKNVFFTNFKNSIYFENLQSTQKSLQIIKKQRQFHVLLKQDIIGLAKIQINPEVYSFKNQIEKKLYETFSQILRKIINPNILQTLLKILNQKQLLRTTANTNEPLSPKSPCPSSIRIIKGHNRSNTSIQSERKGFRNSVSGLNLPLKDSLSYRGDLLLSKKIFPKQSSTTINSSRSRLSSSTKFVQLKTQVLFTQRPSIQSIKTSQQKDVPNKQRQCKRKESFESIIKNRKLLQFILRLVKHLNIKNNTKLTILLLIKCEQLLTKIKENIQIIKSQPLTIKRQKQFINIVDSQLLITQKYLTFLKQSSLGLVNLQSNNNDKLSYKSIRQYCLKNKLYSLQDNLSAEIYTFINKEMQTIKKQPISQTCKKNTSQSSCSGKINPEKQSVQKQSVNSSLLKSQYEKSKWLYYFSIKLKYNSFQIFYDKKVSHKSSQLDIFKQDYFLLFQTQSIPIDQIIDEVISRLNRYNKKYRFPVISVK